ncbi:arabinan endo-1,5-alpha-L-arabinosidase [Fodinibius salsisoli]|uniref:Arabinan endo-1,5-alpha-L-arabinosidase n=1 Tax=Fodinibius salsisoli TaxID=2820877 RepID=A0ABT3PIY6_9BACT|nr:arabinan endo-1,5-alpha-L-arabinosidase [Fodinibius salsisoli]MCW9705900.1 arabinan endo-1,5-alpha-L-arabinosidase [Fodinibius salsisoli]
MPLTFKQWFFLIFLCMVSSIGMAQSEKNAIRVHDPVMVQQDDSYYLFATGRGIAVWSSPDMKDWKREESVFEEAPQWTLDMNPDFRNHIWAPDIAEYNGTYYLYYSVSQFGRNKSAIGVVTNETMNPNDPNYEWVDHGPVVQSVPGRDLWNAIDPNLSFDDEGTPWLSFGSYWRGIKIVQLKKNLTEITTSPQSWRTIASRHRYWKLDVRDAGNKSSGDIEAPFIFKKNGFYYLFASWDRCCAGKESTYKVVVGRSENITGPYLDKTDKKMIHGGGTLVTKGNKKWAAVGHQAAYTFDDTDYLIFHGYDNEDDGDAKLIIREIEWTDGWPAVKL